MVVDIRMELHRPIGIVNCGLDRVAVQNFRHFQSAILSTENARSSVSKFGIGAAHEAFY